MPWSVGKSSKCPASKPWAVTKDSDGTVEGCHASAAAAKKQQAALYANEPGRSGGHMTTAVERRFTPGKVELRQTETRGPRIGGFAIVYNVLSRNLGGFVERANAGVVNGSRADGWPEVVARFDHENAYLLGTIAGGTLALEHDPGTGLSYLVEPPKARADIVEMVERGDVSKSSFAFRMMPGGDDWGVTDQGYPMRTLLDVQLVDVAPVVSPAYADTSAGLRSLAAKFEAEVEEVRSMAAADELRRFFVKTESGKPIEKAKPRMFGPAAAAALLTRKSDPWS